MEVKKLTKRENEIMEILWNSNKEMSATDIMNASNGISMNTIQQTIQKLLKMDYICVSSIGMNKKALTRFFRPNIEEAEYVSAFISKNTYAKLASNFIKQTDNDEILDELSDLIEKKRKGIKL